MYALSVLAFVFLVPFAVHDFLKDRIPLAVSIVVVVVAFGVDGYALRRRRKPPIPYALLLVPISAAITLSLVTQGVIGAFWCYPAVLFFFFVLPRRAALLCSFALLLVGTVMVHRYLSMRITVRFCASLLLTIVIVDIIQNIIRELQRRLLAQAITDPLTGAFNRRYMVTRIREALEGQRRGAPPASLLLLDIDHFKLINDEHGHDVGDTVLKGVVSEVRTHTRKVDLLFRMGGEEFVVLVSDMSEGDAVALAEDVRRSIAEASLIEGRPVTVSIGVGGTRSGDTLESWIKGADAAMYAAKEGGRDRVMRRGALARATS